MRSFVLVAAAMLLFSTTAQAGPYADTLGRCLTSATSSSDQATLIRWIFTSVSVHPEINDVGEIDPSTRDQIHQEAASLYERLILDDCREETREAVRNEGASALESGFGVLGETAMQRLMQNDHVMEEMTTYLDHMDEETIEEVLYP